MRAAGTIVLAVAVAALTIGGGAARTLRHRAAVAVQPTRPAPHEFYPEHVEGGVTGNYAFNNQIRKHTDPLNANGAQ